MAARVEPATPPLLRRLNAGRVLDVLRTHGPQNVTDVATRAGLSRATLDAVADDLIRVGLVAEATSPGGGKARGRGRPPRRLRFRAEGGRLLGIDIGAYRLEVVVTDLLGTPLASRVRQLDPTMTRPRRLRAARQLSTAVLEDIDATAAELRAIGVGTPGIVDGETGSVTYCNAMPGWSGLALAAEVRNAFDCTVAVENDANLAVVGECWKGAARGVDDVVLLMAGERIGAGIVIGGSLVRGKRGGTGEMTFLGMLRDTNPTEGIQEFVHTAARRQVDHLIACGDARSDAVRTLVRDLAPLHGVHVSNLDTMLASVQRGKATAIRQLETALARLCAVSIAVTTLISPELFVLGGQAPAAEELILPPIVEVLHGLSGAGVEPPKVVVSSLGESAVALGAAHKALDLVEPALLDALA